MKVSQQLKGEKSSLSKIPPIKTSGSTLRKNPLREEPIKEKENAEQIIESIPQNNKSEKHIEPNIEPKEESILVSNIDTDIVVSQAKQPQKKQQVIKKTSYKPQSLIKDNLIEDSEIEKDD